MSRCVRVPGFARVALPGLAGASLALATAARAQAPDSARLVRAAHDVQRAFESTRREHLPWTAGGSGRRCDARIGRYCYWHDDAPDTAPPDPAVVVAARHQLLFILDSAARLAPGDGWIAGERVRYRLEAGTPDSAVAAVTPCGAEPWWCDALHGLALHESGRYADAESAFDAALAEMPADERCRWTDLSDLLSGRLASRYARTSCADRSAINARLWWLAQPFYSLGANDRRTEHFARLTMIRIAQNSVWPEVQFWGDDLRAVMLRYGWARWFERVRPSTPSAPSYDIVGHDRQPSFSFFPDARLVDSAYAAVPDDWDFRADDAASRYAPRYLRALEPVRALVSRFLRRDSMLVVAAFSAAGDSVLGRRRLRAELVVAAEDGQRFRAEVVPAASGGALAVMAARAPALASVELFDDSARAAGRVREGVAPLAIPQPNGIVLSDILLFRPSGEIPTSLAEVAPRAVAEASNVAGSELGLYWELYGLLNEGQPVDVTLTIARTGVGWWQRARWALHLGGRDAPMSLRWKDAVRPTDGIAGRSVVVDLSRLEGGRYQIRLQVHVSDFRAVAVERQLDVRR